jgi:diguanylate cyclase (GGDEF)-like protein/PAS domain S-box-containing protein
MAHPSDRRRMASVPAPAPPEKTEVTPSYPELINRLPAILYVADSGDDGEWYYVSPQIESILGFSVEEWCGNPHLWAARLHPDDREQVLRYEQSFRPQSRKQGAVEYRMRHRDGHIVWIRDDAVLVIAADGSGRWHGVLSDITERKEAELELERRAAQQAAVARLGEHGLEGARASDLMQEAVTAAATLLDVELAAVLELVPDEDALLLRAGYGYPRSSIGTLRGPTGTQSQAGYTILTRGPVIVSDWATENRFSQAPVLRELGTKSGATVPIQGHGAPFGALSLQSKFKRSFTPSEIAFLQALANVLADALERQATEDQIRHRALHDPLTGLPNRVLFLDRLEHALVRLERSQSLAAILFLDLDRFKLVNDSLGHQVGDELLAAAAPRLQQAVRASDTVARFGGDEFGILLEDIGAEHEAIEMAERIAAVFTRPFVLAGSEHFVTTSIGIAIARGGEDADALIRDADAAMYRAKERGSARYELFDQAMRDRAIVRLRVENDLRRALARDELRLVYQPVISLVDRSIVGVEALVRWEHPERGIVPPDEFIPVAEEDGLIEPIGRWVLEQACRQAAQWHRHCPERIPLEIAVNLSAAQFAKRSLPDTVGEILRATGLDPRSLSLEITESVILRDDQVLTDALLELKELGVQLVLDDFGTGYSSLSYLTRLPLDVLKVDRSFVDGLGRDPRDTAVTEAIVAMARALSLTAVGEGVETEQQARELAAMGCDLAQGYHFSRPVPASEITPMLLGAPPWLRGSQG